MIISTSVTKAFTNWMGREYSVLKMLPMMGLAEKSNTSDKAGSYIYIYSLATYFRRYDPRKWFIFSFSNIYSNLIFCLHPSPSLFCLFCPSNHIFQQFFEFQSKSLAGGDHRDLLVKWWSSVRYEMEKNTFDGSMKRINVQRSYQILIIPKICQNVQFEIQSYSDFCANCAHKTSPDYYILKIWNSQIRSHPIFLEKIPI